MLQWRVGGSSLAPVQTPQDTSYLTAQPPAQPSHSPTLPIEFREGGGIMGEAVRRHDWSRTPLGTPATWPQSLKTLVGLMLSAPQPMFMAWGRDLTWLYNDAFIPILGHKHPEAIGKPALSVWAEIKDSLQPMFDEVLAGSAVNLPDIQLMLQRHGQPEEAHFNFSYVPARDEAGAVAGLFGACLETTDRILGERQQSLLVKLSDRFRDLRDEGDLSYAVGEFLGTVLGVDRAGYGSVDARKKTISIARDWNAPGVKSLAGVLNFLDYGSYINDLLRGETVVFADARRDPRTQAGADALAAITATAAVNMPIIENGRLVALLYLNHGSPRAWSESDLSLLREVAERARAVIERRRAEQELKALAASLEEKVAMRTAERDQIWKSSRDLLVIVGADGILRAVNPAWTTILGYEPAQLLGRSVRDFVWPDDMDLTLGALNTASSLRDLTSFENRFRHRNGMPRWISWHTSMHEELVYGYGRDVTAEKEAQSALSRAQEALRQSQKMEAVGQLTGGIAHDFNNLLAGISGSLEVIEKLIAQGKAARVERYVQMARGSTRRAAALTQRLLAFSRQQTLDPKPTDINRLVNGMEDLIRRTVGPSVTVEVVGAGGLWASLVDQPQLESALLNLCLNGRDAMAPNGGRLTIETANKWLDDRAAKERDLPPGQYVSLCVTDTGTGMTPEVIARAFDPFFTTKPIGQGTGLGLSMAYGFARQSGGQIRIYSELGKGTTVCVYLPRHLGSVESADGESSEKSAGAGDGETVLVIDDEPTLRTLISELLEEIGYRPIVAADGPNGLKILQSSARIDLLITDVGLPGGLNGRQVADAARRVRPELKVLFITGYAENAAVGNGFLDAGMEILTKPFAMASLAVKIHEMLAP